MPNLHKIATESYSTHFDGVEGAFGAIRKIWLPNTLLSASYVLLFGFLNSEFLTAIGTFLSILIGFSYSVMIYLSSNPFVRAVDDTDREAKIRADRLNDLSADLYKNLHFFAIVSLMVILASAFGLMAPKLFILGIKISIPEQYFIAGALLMNFVYLWILTETCREFLRILQRTDYIFSNRMSKKMRVD